MSVNKFDKYLKTYAGKNLKWPLSEEGIWRVLGEDPNADFHGSHYQPDLGIYQGKLEDVIRAAVEMPNFWQWGAGGEFQKVEIKSISNIKRKIELSSEKEKLKKRLAEIDKELNQ